MQTLTQRAPKLVGAQITNADSGDVVLRHGDVELGPVHEGPARDRLLAPGGALPKPSYDELWRLRQLWQDAGADPFDPTVAALIDRNVGPMAGAMPVGSSGMAFMHNVPEQGSYVENTTQFFQNTERNDIPQVSQPYPGFGTPADFRIPNVGVLASIRVVMKLTLVVGGTGAVTATYQWPWNVGKRFSLNANGQTQIISAEGNDLRARRQRFFRNPREVVSTAPATDVTTAGVSQPIGDPTPGVIANGTYAVVLVYDLPIAHDDYEMAGSLYAQSDQNSLAWRLEAAAQSDLFSVAAGGTVSLTGTVFWTTTVYDIPTADTQKGRIVLLPDMSWIHGFLGTNQPFSNTGEVAIALIRTSGRLLCTYVYLDNGGAAIIDPLALTEVRFQYGGNRRPRTFNPPEQLIEKNTHDYNGRVLPKVGYFLLDNEVDNPLRDLVLPKGVTELQVVANIAAGTTLNTNSHAHFVEETMFKARAQ
jgi:hypothetical protein